MTIWRHREIETASGASHCVQDIEGPGFALRGIARV